MKPRAQRSTPRFAIADDLLTCIGWAPRYRRDVLKMLGGVTDEEAQEALGHLLETGQAVAVDDGADTDFDVIALPGEGAAC